MYGKWYAADKQRFRCGTSLNVCKGSRCIKLRVSDYGPSCFVEQRAGGPVLDASPNVCSYFTGSVSCGWSDHVSVVVTVAAAPEIDGINYGPFIATDLQLREMMKFANQTSI